MTTDIALSSPRVLLKPGEIAVVDFAQPSYCRRAAPVAVAVAGKDTSLGTVDGFVLNIDCALSAGPFSAPKGP